MRFLISCSVVLVPAIALAEPIWCGTSLDTHQVAVRDRPATSPKRRVTVDHVPDAAARATITSAVERASSCIDGTWVRLVVAPSGVVIAATADQPSCVAALRSVHFEPAVELRTLSAHLKIANGARN